MKRRFYTLNYYFFLFTVIIAGWGAILTTPNTHAAVIQRAPNNLGLVGYWSFDEGRGNILGDMSGSGNDGTLAGDPQWTHGIVGGALEFDGVDDWIDDVSQPAIQTSPNEFTVAGFINPTDHTSRFITPGSNGVDQWIGYGGDRERIQVMLAESGDTNTRARYSTPGSVPVGEWTHWVVSINDKSVKIYINGELDSEYTESINIGAWENRWRIGQRGNGTNWYQGKLDELRVYNRILSAAEVQALHSSTKNTTIGTTPTDRYTDGLIAHWTFDGKDITETTIKDVAGTSDGTVVGDAAPTMGVIGQGMKFDGGGDKVATSSDPDLAESFSVSFWAKVPHTGDWDIALGTGRWATIGGWHFGNGSREFFRFGFQTADFASRSTLYASDLPFGEWIHFVGMYDAETGVKSLYVNGELESSSSSHPYEDNDHPVNLGANSRDNSGDSHRYWEGELDDVRIYNRALSADEVISLYTAAKPSTLSSSTGDLLDGGLVGMWPFDEGSGGTTKNEVTGSEDKILGAEWTEGVSGTALHFDGVNNDSVNIVNIPNAEMEKFTLAAWVFNESGGDHRQSMLRNYWEILNDTRLCYYSYQFADTYWRCTPGGTVSLDDWVHVATTWDGSVIRHYVDGQLVWTDSNPSTGANNSISEIAGYSDRRLKGSLDNVRIYNRTLSGGEIQQLYNMEK